MATAPKQQGSVFSMALVVTGNLIGAGILALPVNTGLAGFGPAFIGIICMWALMLTTAMILAAQPALSASATADLPSFFQKELGSAGKWITIVANLLILYGLLVAYLSGAGAVMQKLFGTDFPTWAASLLFFTVATLLSLFGLAIMAKGNAILMVLMWCAFGLMIAFCVPKVEMSRFSYTDWGFLPVTLPVVITGFHFHNVIPSICRNLGNDQRAIRKALLLGTVIGLCMNLAWAIVVMGALDVSGENSLYTAFEKNLPATIPLLSVLKSNTFVITASTFALLAMLTSYMANGVALASFVTDLVQQACGRSNRWLSAALAFLPPLVVAMADPNLFLKAINIVGGVGIDLIFGILPGVLLIKYKTGMLRKLGWLLVVAFGAILILELGQEFGLLRIAPHVEHWSAHLPK
jgi:tyrosine-specific transport protein